MATKIQKILPPKVFVYAHNLKAFDGRFVLRELWSRNYQEITPILAGSKILKIDIGLVRFLDSVSFFQMPSLKGCQSIQFG